MSTAQPNIVDRDGCFMATPFAREWLCDVWRMASEDECARQWERVAWMLLGAVEWADGAAGAIRQARFDVPLLNAAYEQACARAHMAQTNEQRLQARIRRRPAMISAELRAHADGVAA